MFYDRLKIACKGAHTTVTATLKAIGIGTANGTYWKNGSAPSSDVVVKLAEFLNVSTDYLLLGKNGTELDLNSDTIELISAYNSVDTIGKAMIKERALTLSELATGRAAAEQQFPKVERSAVPTNARIAPKETEHAEEFYIDLCSLPASAGTGVQLDENYTEPLRIEHSLIAERANYAVRVSGNSMEDKYYDGDIVLVETCPEVDIGEIGLFIVNDQGYIKERGEDRLISLNPASPDVMIKESDVVYCRGRVLGKAEIIK